MPYMPQNVKDQRRALVNKIIIDMLNDKVFMWDKGFVAGQAVNGYTNSPYRGGNIIRLAYSAHMNGFKDRRWMTFKQAQEKGYKIKKGSKGTAIEYFDVKQLVPEQYSAKTKDGQEVEPETRNIAFVKSYVVFNGDQIEGMPPDEQVNINKDRMKSAEMEKLLQKSEAKIYYDQMNSNFYSPVLDEIHIVPRERFKDNSHFYGTVAHEIVHSTGHESRLNRQLQTKDKEQYAREELVAELATMFMAQEYGFSLDEQHKENHKAYIISWCQALKDNPDELFRAARLADKAVEYINSKMLEKNRELEQGKQPVQANGMEEFAEPAKEKEAARSVSVQEQLAPEKEAKAKSRTAKTKGKGKSLEKGMAM